LDESVASYGIPKLKGQDKMSVTWEFKINLVAKARVSLWDPCMLGFLNFTTIAECNCNKLLCLKYWCYSIATVWYENADKEKTQVKVTRLLNNIQT